MAEEWTEGASKKAKQKARKRAAAAEAEAAPAPAPTPEPKAKAKGKAKAEPAAPAPPPAAEPKAKAKGKAKEEPAAEAKAAPAEPKAKAKGKAKAQAAAAAPPPKERTQSGGVPMEFDDGEGGEWEVATAVSKKNAKRQQKLEEEKAAKAAEEAAAKAAEAAAAKEAAAKAKAAAKPKSKGKKEEAPKEEKKEEKKEAGAAAVAAAPAASPATPEAPAVDEGPALYTEDVKVPDNMIGRVIGPKGSTLKMINEKTGVVRIDTIGATFTIAGDEPNVKKAVEAINELVTKGHTSLAYDDYAETSVQVHPTQFPSIIGERGWIIRKIKEEVGAEIEIPPMPKQTPPPGKKFKVTIAGDAANAEKAKEILNELLTNYHSEITHPGMVHEEMQVQDWAYRFIIGTKGSELRHIQSNFRVKVHVPREYSNNQNVVVVGEPEDVKRAKAYIEKTIWNAEHKPRGRGAEGGGGYEDEGQQWGEDDAVDGVAAAYLIRRR